MRARSASHQRSPESVSAAPSSADSAAVASRRYRPGTSSPISMLAIRRGSTSETTDCRTAYRLTNANALAARNEPSRSPIPFTNRASHTSRAPSDSYQSASVYCWLPQRPASRTSAATANVPMTARRLVTSDGHALPAEPAFHLGADLGQACLGACLEAGDEDGLRVGGADQSPPVAEQHANSIDVDDVVAAAEVRDRLLHERELDVVAAVDANLRRAHELGHVGEQLVHGPAGIGDDLQQPRRAIECVVEAVVAVGEEHVARHLARERRLHLLHLLLDEGVARLPHDGNAARLANRVGERLAALHVEDD